MDSFHNDIPLDLAQRAHNGTSFVPERRGEQERESYASALTNDYEVLAALAKRGPTPEVSLAAPETEFQRYREGYKRHTLVCLERRSRCLSTFIAGPSGFNSSRANKANNSERRSVERLTEFRTRALAAIRKAIRPDLSPIMAGDSNATDRLREKLAKLEKEQATMKAANAAIRKHAKAGQTAQVAALVAVGFLEKVALNLLEPDFCGRLGFADYKTKNNGAEIRRLKARIGQVETAQATPSTETQGARARIEDSPAENRVRLFFPGKPAEEVRSRLKSAGFRWTPTLGCWQAYRNHHSLTTAQAEAGVLAEGAESVGLEWVTCKPATGIL